MTDTILIKSVVILFNREKLHKYDKINHKNYLGKRCVHFGIDKQIFQRVEVQGKLYKNSVE